MEPTRYRIHVPRKFAIDHIERDLPSGINIPSKAKRCMVFDATVDEIREWLSDADYYSDCAGQGWGMGGGAALGLQSSAKATAKRMTLALDQIKSGLLKPANRRT